MKNYPTIIYRKDGIEKRIKLNPHTNVLDMLVNEAIAIRDNISEDRIIIYSEIQFIKFQNFYYLDYRSIKCNRNTTCIFEKCRISSLKREFTFGEGKFRLIDTKLENNATIRLSETSDLRLQFDKNDNNKYKLETDISLNNCIKQNIEIKSNSSISQLRLESDTINLHGKFIIEVLRTEGNTIIIGNQEEQTKIIIEERRYKHKIETINANKLYLTNCIIQNDIEENTLFIKYKQLIGKNFVIKSRGNICINEKIYSENRDKDDYIIITEKELVEENFKDFLKKLSKKIELEAIAEAENTIPEKFGKHLLDQMEKTTKEIEKQEIILENLRNKYNNQKQKLQSTREEHKNKLIKKLKRKSINDFI